MSEKRFSIFDDDEVEDVWNELKGTIYCDNEEEAQRCENWLNNLHSQNQKLKEENERLRQTIKHCSYVDVNNKNGCMNCKFNFESHCIIMCCRSYDYLEGISKCNLKYWEGKDE